MFSFLRRITLALAYAQYGRNIALSQRTKTNRIHDLFVEGMEREDAVHLANLEQLCNERLWLPTHGLWSVQERLEKAGFWFDSKSRRPELIGCLFPKGWHLDPIAGETFYADLIDPQGDPQALVFYKCVSPSYQHTFIY